MTQDAKLASRAMSEATQVGQRVDADRLIGFLKRQPELEGLTLAIEFDDRRREAGASSGTKLFTLIITRGGAHERRQLVFRYDLGGAFFKQYDLPTQFSTMRALREQDFCAPAALWLDAEGEVCGKPGLVMARIEGAAPTLTPFQDGPLMAVSAEQRREMLLNAARATARLNAADLSRGGFDHLRERGSGAHFIDREINWTRTELRLALPPKPTPPQKVAFYQRVVRILEAVGDKLVREAPRHRAPELAHGDANITNFMYRGTAVAALLDYELSHIGIGEADLGYQLAGIAHFRLLAPPTEGVPSEEEMLEAYRDARGKVEDWAYAKLMGEWRLAVYAAMGMSRLPPELASVERTYIDDMCERLLRLAPEIAADLDGSESRA